MSDNAAETQVPSESTIDLSTTHIILLGLGGFFGLLLGAGLLALVYYCHRKNKLKDKEKEHQGTVLSCDECVGAATLTENIETAGTVVLDMDQVTTSSEHVHSSMIDDTNILRHNRASSTKCPADSNNQVDFPLRNSVGSPFSVDYTAIDFPVDSSPINSVDCPLNTSVDVPIPTITSEDSPSNNSVDFLPNTPVESAPNNNADSTPYNSLHSPPNNSVDSLTNTPVESPPNNSVDSSLNNSVHSFPNNSVHSPPNNSVHSSPNSSVHSLPNAPVESPPNNSVDSLPNTSVESAPNNSVDSSPNNSVDSPPNNSVHSPNNSVYSPPNNSVHSFSNTPVDSPQNISVDNSNNSVHSFPNTPVPVDSPPNTSVDNSPNNSVHSFPNTPVDSPPNTLIDSPNSTVHSFPNAPVDSPPNDSVDSSPTNSLHSSPKTSLDSPKNSEHSFPNTPGDISHPEAMSPNISNQTSTESPVAVSPHNLEDVESIEMPEHNFVLPNRELCQEEYLSVRKDEATPCKEDGYIGEGDGDLICKDSITKNKLVVKDTVKETNVLSELQILQEKVRALEQQNAALIKAHSPSEIHDDEKEKTKDKDAHSSRAINEGLNSSVGSFKIEDIKLIDVDSLEREGGTWLMTVNKGQVKEGLEIPVAEMKGQTPILGSPMEGMEWLRRESGVSEDLAASRNTLVNRLNGMANAFMLPAWIQKDSNSHLSQVEDLRRSMPNLNKKCRGAARPQYSLSQNQNSETRLQGPSHLQAPESQQVTRGTIRAPTCLPNSRGRPAPGGRKLHSGPRPSSEGLARKSSLPVGPAGTSSGPNESNCSSNSKLLSTTGPNGLSRLSSTKLPSGTKPSSNGPSGTSRSSSIKPPSSNGQYGTRRSSSIKLPSVTRPSSNGINRSSSTKLPSGTRPSSNGSSGTGRSSSTKLPSSTGLPAPSARRGLARGNIAQGLG